MINHHVKWWQNICCCVFSFMSIWIHEVLFIKCFTIQLQSLFFFDQIIPSLVSKSSFMLAPVSSWHTLINQSLSDSLLSGLRHSIQRVFFLFPELAPRALAPFSGEFYLESKNWVLYVLILTGVTLCLGPFSGQSQKID